MDITAVEKAKRRLARAEECLAMIDQPQAGHESFLPLWTDFLLALGGVYTALEQGAKLSPQSRQWFGGKKRERNNQLLQYLHQARNAEEHGLDPVSMVNRAKIVNRPDSPKAHVEHLTDRDFNIVLDEPAAGPFAIEVEQPTIRLVPVRDNRFGTTYELPTEHMGKPLENDFPLTVAKLGVAYVRSLVGDAERMAQKTSSTTTSSG